MGCPTDRGRPDVRRRDPPLSAVARIGGGHARDQSAAAHHARMADLVDPRVRAHAPARSSCLPPLRLRAGWNQEQASGATSAAPPRSLLPDEKDVIETEPVSGL